MACNLDSGLQLGLFDHVPDAWLLLLLEASDAQSSLAMFRTCTAMRDRLLPHARRLCFPMPIPPKQMASAHDSIERASLQSPSITLVLGEQGQLENREGDAVWQHHSNVNTSCVHLMHGAVAQGGELAFTNVELVELSLDALVPHWLLFTCPDMTKLSLRWCTFEALPDPTISVPECWQLRELDLVAPVTDIDDQPAFSRWQHQFRALTGLEQLRLRILFGGGEGSWLQCCRVVGTHLTHLDYPYNSEQSLPPQFTAWYPNLCELHMRSLRVDDEGMEALLSLPSLQQLQVDGFDLQHSYTHRPCTWSVLLCTELAIDQFALLPLENVKWLQSTTTIKPSSNPPANSSVVEAITRCGGIRWGNTRSISLYVAQLNDVSGLAVIVPLLAGCKATHLTVHRADPVTRELLTALQPFLTSLPLTTVKFQECSWTQVCAVVLPSLPVHIQTIELQPRGVLFTEQQLTLLCVHAHNPVSVVLLGGTGQWEVGWEERVQQAMTAAGHNVRLGGPRPLALTMHIQPRC